jgi:hypothetical protein
VPKVDVMGSEASEARFGRGGLELGGGAEDSKMEKSASAQESTVGSAGGAGGGGVEGLVGLGSTVFEVNAEKSSSSNLLTLGSGVALVFAVTALLD